MDSTKVALGIFAILFASSVVVLVIGEEEVERGEGVEERDGRAEEEGEHEHLHGELRAEGEGEVDARHRVVSEGGRAEWQWGGHSGSARTCVRKAR